MWRLNRFGRLSFLSIISISQIQWIDSFIVSKSRRICDRTSQHSIFKHAGSPEAGRLCMSKKSSTETKDLETKLVNGKDVTIAPALETSGKISMIETGKIVQDDSVVNAQTIEDIEYMKMAIELAQMKYVVYFQYIFIENFLIKRTFNLYCFDFCSFFRSTEVVVSLGSYQHTPIQLLVQYLFRTMRRQVSPIF